MRFILEQDDWDLQAPWSNNLYKAVVDATIVDPRS
jgi:hypothetical protein